MYGDKTQANLQKYWALKIVPSQVHVHVYQVTSIAQEWFRDYYRSIPTSEGTSSMFFLVVVGSCLVGKWISTLTSQRDSTCDIPTLGWRGHGHGLEIY